MPPSGESKIMAIPQAPPTMQATRTARAKKCSSARAPGEPPCKSIHSLASACCLVTQRHSRNAKLLPIVTVGPSRPHGYPVALDRITATNRTAKIRFVNILERLKPFSQPLFSGAPEPPASGASPCTIAVPKVAKVAARPIKANMPAAMPPRSKAACMVLNLNLTRNSMVNTVQRLARAMPTAVSTTTIHAEQVGSFAGGERARDMALHVRTTSPSDILGELNHSTMASGC
mmetsp:Transcript_10657/g.25080  ORF Transcript_10657/g.25080 Transcript_10657/m.25080 type:complete len:231 (-) Transcript_10657:18-710(-)